MESKLAIPGLILGARLERACPTEPIVRSKADVVSDGLCASRLDSGALD
jgi:hypothetical protein